MILTSDNQDVTQRIAAELGVIALLILVFVLGWVQFSGAAVLHEGSAMVVVLNAPCLLTYRKA